MPGPHYAISEAFIVLAAIWCTVRLVPSGHWWGALGSAIFGIAAAIGVYRFGASQMAELAGFHKNFSQIGGSIAMALMSAQLLLEVPLIKRAAVAKRIVTAAVFASAVAAFAIPALTTLLFIIWLLAAIVAAAMMPTNRFARRLSFAAIVSVFLINLLLIRQSPHLNPDISWHLFHVLVALWLLGMIYVMEYRRSNDEVSRQ